jgi:hypothetical protein
MNKEEIKQLLINGLTIQEVIDAVIEINGIIGVGLITLGDNLQQYCYNNKSGYYRTDEPIEDQDKNLDFGFFDRYKDDSDWGDPHTSPPNLRYRDDGGNEGD